MDYKKIVFVGNNSVHKQDLIRNILGDSFREVSRSFETIIYEFIYKKTIISLWDVNEDAFFDALLVGASGIIFLADLHGAYNLDTSLENLKIIDKALARFSNIPLVIYVNPKITKRITKLLSETESTNIRFNLNNPIEFIVG